MNENILKKFCPKCEIEKDFSEFVKNKARPDGVGSYCKKCHNDLHKKFDKQHPGHRKLRGRRNHLMSSYGITLEEYDRLLEKQNYRCAICGAFDPGNRNTNKLFVDHDHKINKVRGLLCDACNLVIGRAKDNIQILESAINYLKES